MANGYLIEQEELERVQVAEKEAKKANQAAKKRFKKNKEKQSRLYAS
jgi:hypothetical protein